MATIIQLRRDTAANWTANNPILADGEPGLEKDTGKEKTGDGVTPWNELAYKTGMSSNSPELEQRIDDLESANSIDPNLANTSHAPTYLKIPTPDGTFQTVHPSVVYFANGWNGWKYWMVHTPYANADETKEIPCIAVSNDRITWTTPAGLINPIVGPSQTGHYADPDMIFFNGKLHLTFLDTGFFWYMNSSDGVNWSDPVNLSVPAGLSPCFIKDGDKFITYHVNDNVSPRVIRRAESNTFTSGYTTPENISMNNFPAGYNPWHVEVKKYKSQFHILVNCRIDGGNDNTLLFGTSQDGKIFEMANDFLLEPLAGSFADARLYKSSMVLITEDKYALWYSSVSSSNVWRISYSEVTLNEFIGEELTETIGVALSDEASDLVASTTFPVLTLRMPFSKILKKVLLTIGAQEPTGADLIVEVRKDGIPIFSTNPRIDAGGTNSNDSVTQQVLKDSFLRKNDKIEFLIIQVGSTSPGKGLKAYIE